MPNDQIGDYPQTMLEFGLHWQSVNTSLGGTPETAFKLAGGYDQAQFMADRDAIVAKLTEIEGLKNELDFARADRDELRNDLRQRLILFRSSRRCWPACRSCIPATAANRCRPIHCRGQRLVASERQFTATKESGLVIRD